MRHVVAFVPDLMDRSRLRSTDAVTVRLVGLGQLAALGGPDQPDEPVDLVVVDLTRPGALDAVEALAGRWPVLGFGPHVDDDLLAAARAAGCTEVLPRSRFFARWPDV